jgi:cytidylate kinase
MTPESPDTAATFQIALDGPAGAGKSTVARGVARALGFTYLDTGAMYRAVGLKARRMTGPDAEPDWGAVAEDIHLRFERRPDGQHMVMDGEDVEAAIRTPEISDWSSRVSADPRVRRALTQRMRAMARAENVVMEGRDIGTVVLPDARLKIFLTAPEEERARRRALELAQKGDAVSNADVRREMAERDRRDATRADAPLVKARDAVEVNTAGLSAEEVIDRIATMARERM